MIEKLLKSKVMDVDKSNGIFLYNFDDWIHLDSLLQIKIYLKLIYNRKSFDKIMQECKKNQLSSLNIENELSSRQELSLAHFSGVTDIFTNSLDE